MYAIESLQQQFRTQTRQLHRELDSLEPLTGLLVTPFSAERYAAALSALLLPHAYLEQTVINGLATRNIAYRYTPRSAYLSQDLTCIDGGEHSTEVHHQPPQPDTAQLFGLLYLLEGSKLGGAFLLKRLTAAGAPDEALRFFQSAANEQSDWQAFWQACQIHLRTEEALDRSVQAAASAFAFYIDSVRSNRLQPQLLLPELSINQGVCVSI